MEQTAQQQQLPHNHFRLFGFQQPSVGVMEFDFFPSDFESGSPNGNPAEFLQHMLSSMMQSAMGMAENSNHNNTSPTNESSTNAHSGPHQHQFFFQPIFNFNIFNMSDILNQHLFQGQPPASKRALSEQLKPITLQTEDILKELHCTICMEDYHEGQQVSEMPCKHFYHTACLESWLKQSNTCPHCRYELLTDNEDYNRGVQERMAKRSRTTSLESDFGVGEESHAHHHECALHVLGTCTHTHSSEEHPHTNNNEEESTSNNGESKQIQMSECGHRFHSDCLKSALRINGYQDDALVGTQEHIRCPHCRKLNAVQF